MDHPWKPGWRQPSVDRLGNALALSDEQLCLLWGELLQICVRLVGSRTDLDITEEDLLHDVLIDLLHRRSVSLLASPEAFLSYFKAAAKSRFIDAMRKRIGRGRAARPASVELSQFDASIVPARGEGPGYSLTMAEDLDWALSWLKQNLSPWQVGVFVSYLEGRTVKEIASSRGLKFATVAQMLSRIRIGLRAAAKRRR